MRPPEGAERGPIKKFASSPRQNWGPGPQFLEFVFREPRPPTNPENFTKIALRISDKNFFRKFDENLIFLELGELPTGEKFCVDAPQALYMWSKFGPDRLRFRYLFGQKNCFSPLPPGESVRRPYKYYIRQIGELIGTKNSNNGVG